MRPSSSLSMPPRIANTPTGIVTKMNIPRCDVTGRISVSVLVKHFILQFRLSEGYIRAAAMSLWRTALQSKMQVTFGKNGNSHPNRRERNLLPTG